METIGMDQLDMDRTREVHHTLNAFTLNEVITLYIFFLPPHLLQFLLYFFGATSTFISLSPSLFRNTH